MRFLFTIGSLSFFAYSYVLELCSFLEVRNGLFQGYLFFVLRCLGWRVGSENGNFTYMVFDVQTAQKYHRNH